MAGEARLDVKKKTFPVKIQLKNLSELQLISATGPHIIPAKNETSLEEFCKFNWVI